MQIIQSADSPDSTANFVSLSNWTTGAIWEPLSFKLDRTTGLISPVRKERADEPVPDGIGANVITLSKGCLLRRMLAIYKVRGEWMLFDGGREYHLESVDVTWTKGMQIIPGVFSLATLALNCGGVTTAIKYFRPSLRHWAEGGWALEDIDIGHSIACFSKDPVARARLDDALNMRKGVNL